MCNQARATSWREVAFPMADDAFSHATKILTLTLANVRLLRKSRFQIDALAMGIAHGVVNREPRFTITQGVNVRKNPWAPSFFEGFVPSRRREPFRSLISER